MPNKELVVIGAVALVGFVVAGVVAVVAVYWFDRQGTASRATRRGLLVLTVVEILVALYHGGFKLHTALLLGAGFLVAGVLVAYLVEEAAPPPAPPPPPPPPDVEEADDGASLPEQALMLVTLLALLLGVLVVARAHQWVFVVLWALPTLVLVGIWAVLPPAQALLRRALALALLVYGLVALLRFEGSLAALTLATLALAAINLAVARGTGTRFAFYGVSVFLSVVLFGGVLSYARSIDTPKLQGVAVLVKNGGRSECGLYVTETDSRLYLARVTVVPRNGRPKVVAGSGRIFWIPRDRIERSELGPLQGVAGAQEDASALRDELEADRQRASTQPVAGPAEPKGAVAIAADANECTPGPRSFAPRQTPERALARQFQPRVVIDRQDGFWPISALTIFKLKHGDRHTCRRVGDGECVDVRRADQLPWIGGVGEWLDYPGSNTDEKEQHEDMVDALGSPDPAKTAREYFFTTGEDGATTSLQYWFYYAFNYQRLGFHGLPIGRAGYHEGDFETLGLLLSKSKKAVYAYMARHDDEGRPFVVSESQLAHTGDHLTAYAARGSHATYDSCGRQHRSKAPGGLIDDRPQCDPARQLVLEPEITPLSDLALAPWACWQGRFGHVPNGRIESAADLYFAAGPRSPLWQQKFGPRGTRGATPCAAVRDEPDRPDAGEEVLSDGVGKQLRDNGGRLDKLFDTCPAWRKPPSAGVYVVACDGRALAGFFKSGLEDTGGSEISIRGTGQKPEPASIPAVYRRTDAVSPEGVSISANRPATVSIYAVCYSGEERIEASFPAVRLAPARAVTVRIGDRTWTLTGLATPATTTPETKAKTARCRG